MMFFSIAVIALAGQAWATPGEEVLLQFRFKTIKGYRLSVSQHGGLDPLLLETLDARDPSGKISRVRSLADLAGKVRIVSRDGALDYVRLLTSPRTYRSFGEDYILEVLPETAANVQLCFGDQDFFTRRVARLPARGVFGIVPLAVAKENGYQPPRIDESAEGYVVRRFVVLKENGVKLVALASERVTREGRYTRIIESEQRAWPNVTWFRP